MIIVVLFSALIVLCLCVWTSFVVYLAPRGTEGIGAWDSKKKIHLRKWKTKKKRKKECRWMVHRVCSFEMMNSPPPLPLPRSLLPLRSFHFKGL